MILKKILKENINKNLKKSKTVLITTYFMFQSFSKVIPNDYNPHIFITILKTKGSNTHTLFETFQWSD